MDLAQSFAIFYQVFMHQSIFTVDLEAECDPLRPSYSASSIFRVSHPSRVVTLEDINNIIKNVKDPENTGRSHHQKVQYEIGLTARWFIVAARTRTPRTVNAIDPSATADYASTLERRSTLLLLSLHKHFPRPSDEITSLEDVLMGSKVSWSSAKRIKKKRETKVDNTKNVKEEEEEAEKDGVVSRVLSAFGFGSRKRKQNTNELVSVSKKSRTNGTTLP